VNIGGIIVRCRLRGRPSGLPGCIIRLISMPGDQRHAPPFPAPPADSPCSTDCPAGLLQVCLTGPAIQGSARLSPTQTCTGDRGRLDASPCTIAGDVPVQGVTGREKDSCERGREPLSGREGEGEGEEEEGEREGVGDGNGEGEIEGAGPSEGDRGNWGNVPVSEPTGALKAQSASPMTRMSRPPLIAH
jgi:hypothetical protein